MRFSSQPTRLLATATVSALLFAGHAYPQEAADQRKPLTPEASISQRSIADLQLSPDGNRLAFVVAEPPKGEHRSRHIWIYDKSATSARQFTASPKSESHPRWSPDGKQLAFLSNRGDQQQIYVMRTDGGEAVALTKGKRSVSQFEWSPDGKQIAFAAPDAKSEDEEKKEKDKDDAHVVDKEDKHARLWLTHHRQRRGEGSQRAQVGHRRTRLASPRLRCDGCRYGSSRVGPEH